MYYIEITLLENPELPPQQLLRRAVAQAHLGFAGFKEEFGENRIGLGFPDYSPEYLGARLRLFADSKEALLAYNAPGWFLYLRSFVHVSKIYQVPEACGHACFSRVYRRSPLQLAKKLAKAKGISMDEALLCVKNRPLPDFYPGVRITSHSNGNPFLLCVKMEIKPPMAGKYDSFGLSKTATVPVF